MENVNVTSMAYHTTSSAVHPPHGTITAPFVYVTLSIPFS